MRTVFMAYLTGSLEAVDFYCKAFKAESHCFKNRDEDEFYAHAEIVLNGQTILAISEVSCYDMKFTNGNNMQFWLTFDDEKSLIEAYGALKEGAEIGWALAPCEWAKMMADVTDKYGIRWLLNVF